MNIFHGINKNLQNINNKHFSDNYINNYVKINSRLVSFVIISSGLDWRKIT